MAKKTLAQQIEELSKPEIPDFDIEDSERGVFDHHSGSDSEDNDGADDDALRSEHYVNVGKSKLRQNGIHLVDSKYKGKTSSRKDIFEESEVEDNSSDGGEEEEDDDDGDDDEVSEESELLNQSDSENGGNESVEGSDDGSDEDVEQESEDSFDESDHEESTADSKRLKLKEMMANERKQIINRLSSSNQTEALKGYAVISQQKTFDKIIDSRIKIQKALSNANSLPLTNEAFEEFADEETSSLVEDAENSLSSLLNTLLSFRAANYNKVKATKENVSFKPKKRSFSDFVSETERLDKVLEIYRNNTLVKWSHKVQSASGAQALNTSKFKALNQSAAQQVEVNLVDMDRLIKRTRLNRRNVTPLGRIAEEAEEDQTQIDRSLKEDADVFDDEDFYRVLLNDLVDKKISESNPTSGLVITKTKVKRNVDTKASKGRKLKFTVQEPIQNYEVPKGNFAWDNNQIDEFFAGLLGQRVDFAEHSDQSESEDEDEELKNDDLKVFG